MSVRDTGAATYPFREVPLGGQRALMVRRTLPNRDVRTIGAFCFVDHYGPASTAAPTGNPMVVPPHPHMGLQTVSWLLSGTIDHHDSVGSIQRVRPGELNLMTAGRGIAHSEYSVGDAPLHGVQLWVALPDASRQHTPHFEHHGELPAMEDSGLRARVIMGSLMEETSKASTYSPIVCAELTLGPGQHRIGLLAGFEHGWLPLTDAAVVNGALVARGQLRHEPEGQSSATLEAERPVQVLMLGGEPFAEDLLMWWNFVGRTHEEIVQARDDWQHGRRFGAVLDDGAAPLPAPDLPTVRLKPRSRS
ncbi:MAG TPA: pirin family protein [Actinomycetes bacterium]|nr:pirin family protein [Actinomycetes bacterium]